jgi:hypothetical protein
LGDGALSTWTDNRDGPPNSRDVYVADMDNETGGGNLEYESGFEGSEE